MSFSQFENKASKELQNHVSSVDAEALWQDLLPELHPKKRRRGFFLLWFLSLVTVSVLGYWIFSGEMIVGEETKGTTLTADAIQQSPTPKEANPSLTTISDEQTTTPNATPETTEFTTTNMENTVATTSTVSKAKNKIKAIKIDRSERFNQVASKGKKPVVKEEIILDANTIASIPSKVEMEVALTPIIADTEEKENPTEPTDVAEPVMTESEKMAKEVVVTEIVETETPITEEIAEEITPEEESKPKAPSRGFSLKKLTYGIGIHGGIGRSTASLDATDAFNSYVTTRQDSEKQLETLQFGLDFFAKADNGLYLRSGVEYARIGRLFTFKDELVTYDTAIGTIEIRINSITMDTQFIQGPIVTTMSTTYNKEMYNYFHLVEIPLIVGYAFESENNPFSIGVEAGALFNVMLQRKGQIFSPERTFYDLDTDTNDWYKTNLGVRIHAAIRMEYAFNPNMRLSFSPTFRFPANFSKSNNPIKQQHATLGVQLGMQYLFD